MKRRTYSALDGWIDIFRSGNHTDSHGEARLWTNDELDEIVESARANDHAPVVVGHPSDDAPAYGWVAKLRRRGDRLQARLKHINQAFRRAVKSGGYRNRSVALQRRSGRWHLRHLGFLGATPPAVEGLSPSQFAQKTQNDYLYKDKLMDAINRGIASSGTQPEGVFIPKDARGTGKETSGDQEICAARERLDEQKVEFSLEVAAFEEKKNRERARKVIERHVATGRLLPAERIPMSAFLAALDRTSSFMYADDAPKTTMAALFERFLKSLPKRIAYGEHSHASKSLNIDKPGSLAVAARKLMNENDGMTIDQAVRKLKESS